MMMMKQGLLPWSPCCRPYFPPLYLSPPPFTTTTKPPNSLLTTTTTSTSTAALNSVVDDSTTATALSTRERRQLRQERRESKPTYNWKEDVEEKLIKKPTKRYKSWTEELNLDNLADLGPQWWGLKVSRTTYQDTTQRMARSLIRSFPDIPFKVYAPAVQVKRKLKDGSISIKPKPIFPGCVFLKCVLNKQLHDFVRECNGVGGFVGSKVGNTKRQINRPRPVSDEDMEAVFRQAKEEQEKVDQDFEEEQRREGVVDSNVASMDISTSSKPKRRSRKASVSLVDGLLQGALDKSLVQGSTVRIVSGSFADFSGTIQKLDRKRGLATVKFTLFGKETLADLHANEFVAETN